MSLLDQLEQARVFRAEIDYLQTRDEILTTDWKSFRAIRPSVYCRLTEMCDEFYDVHLTSDELRQLALEFESLANKIDATPARPDPPLKEETPQVENHGVQAVMSPSSTGGAS